MSSHTETSSLRLVDGSRVGVIGGGPAGTFFSYFLLEMADRMGLDLRVDIYEPRDFSELAPLGCNMCGGIVSESLVQLLAADGVHLPSSVIQRGIDSYVLHTDEGSVRIETPIQEMRIGAVHRGPGPRDLKEIKWASFDNHLLMLAGTQGARHIKSRVDRIFWNRGRPELHLRDRDPEPYDLLGVAVGVNTAALKMLEGLDLGYLSPRTTKACIRELLLGQEAVNRLLGNSMHVFLLDIPRIEFGAIVPKGEYASLALLGENIDSALLQRFLDSPAVRACIPPESYSGRHSCQCAPRMSVGPARQPFADRLLFLGDCGVTRLYKDGIGAAYRTAKAGARTAVFKGISARDFARHYWPVCRSIENDNRFGRATFALTRQVQRRRFARRALLKTTRREQGRPGHRRRMSAVLWNTFTGSEPYRDIFRRTLHPGFIAWFLWDNLTAFLSTGNARTGGGHD